MKYVFFTIISLIYLQGTSQILISGTEFEPISEDVAKTYYAINEIKHIGLQSGVFTVTPELTPTANANVFNTPYHYAITNNPSNLDGTRYVTLASPIYQFVYSPKSVTSNQNILEYKVTGVVPGSNVSVSIEYGSVVDETKNTICMWKDIGFKAGINLDQWNQTNGVDVPKVTMGKSSSYTLSGVASATGEVVFRVNHVDNSTECSAMGITGIKVFGEVKPLIQTAQGTEVCAGEQITLQSKIPYNAEYTWQVDDGSGWKFLGAKSNELYEAKEVKNYKFRLLLNYNGTTLTSDVITVNAIQCCEINGQPASRKTVFLDDFGTFDLTKPRILTYTDYSDITNPVQKTKTVAEDFRYPLIDAPIGHTYQALGAPNDGNYFVAAYCGYDVGSKIGWAAKIHGIETNPILGYDHSETLEGAMLFINLKSAPGDIIYSRNIDNLCTGKMLYFECWISNFSPDSEPVDITVTLTEHGNASNSVSWNQKAYPQKAGGGYWVRVSNQITLLTGTSLKLQIANNNSAYLGGNDLVIDDIKIMACSAPSLDLFFDVSSLSVATQVCNETLKLETKPTEMLTNFYNNQTYYLYQWTTNPSDKSSWENIANPTVNNNLSIQNFKSQSMFASLENGDTVYFRTIAALESTFTLNSNFVSSQYANPDNPCANYSVSKPIMAVINCPLCTQSLPISITSTDIDNYLCPSESLTLQTSPMQTVNSFDFEWFKGDLLSTSISDAISLGAAVSEIATSSLPVASGNEGTYYVRIRDKNNPLQTSCHQIVSIKVYDAQIPTYTMQGGGAYCPESTNKNPVVIEFSGGKAPYMFDESVTGLGKISNQAIYSIQNPVAGIYKLSNVRDAYGCKAQNTNAEVVVTNLSAPSLLIDSIASVCVGSVVFIDIANYVHTNVSQIQYSTSMGSISTQGILTVSQTPGLHEITVVAFDNNTPACSTSEKISVSVSPKPTKPKTIDSYMCEGNTIPYLTSDGVNDKWYQDEHLKIFTGYIGNTFYPNSIHSDKETYYVIREVNGCRSDISTVSLYIKNNPTIELGENIEQCLQQTAIVSAHVSPLPSLSTHIEWEISSLSDIISIEHTQLDVSRYITNPGDYIIKARYVITEDSITCKSNYDDLLYKALPKASKPIVENSVQCENMPLLPLHAIGTNNIVWKSLRGLPNANGKIYDFANIGIEKLDAGVYEFELYDISEQGCESDIQLFNLEIAENANPQIQGDTTICIGTKESKYFILNNKASSAYVWSITGQNLLFHKDKSESALVNVDWLYSGIDTITVTETTWAGCKGTQTIVVAVAEYPKPKFIWYSSNGNIMLVDKTIQEPICENTYKKDISYTMFWNFGIINDTTFIDAQTDYDEKNIPIEVFEYEYGNYYPKLTVTNEYGCDSSYSEKIFIDVKTGMYVPTAFAPTNSASQVRFFQPIGFNLKECEIWVFDSWGNIVWYSNEVEDGIFVGKWDGTYNSELLQAGVYRWKIKATMLDGSVWKDSFSDSKFGSVTLLR